MKILYTLTTILFFVTAQAQSTQTYFTEANSFFNKHVKNGRVDYKAIKANPSQLDGLIASAEKIRVTTSKPKEYQAFWINTYNLLVIKGIVSKYPVKQPLSIKGFFDKITYNVGGTSTTLNNIEHKFLRGKFTNEPRFHFVLVCAGLGCPPIINEAYIPSKLEAQLQRQTSKAINNPNFIKVKGKKVQFSQIFEWYNGDFTKNGTLVEYVNKYRKEPLDPKTKVSYYPYDWSLNTL